MIALIIGLLICVAIAAVVVGLVAIPARREGRDVLTARGEDLVATLREGTATVVDKVTPGNAQSDLEDQSTEPTAGVAAATVTPEPSDAALTPSPVEDLQDQVKAAKEAAKADSKAARDAAKAAKAT